MYFGISQVDFISKIFSKRVDVLPVVMDSSSLVVVHLDGFCPELCIEDLG